MNKMNRIKITKSLLVFALVITFQFLPGSELLRGRTNDTMHPRFSLLDEAGSVIPAEADIASISASSTCGQCHDTAYIKSHSSHNTEKVSADCFICHLKGGKLNADPSQTHLSIQLPSNQNCAQCHGLIHTGTQALTVPDDYTAGTDYQPGGKYYNITQHTGAILSQQDLSASALNLKDKDKLDFAWDIHTRRQVDCIACHFTRNDPRYGGIIQTAQDHLIRDPRKIKAPHQYLKRPDHRLSSASCSSCHNPFAVHQNMPYEKRHMDVLDCQSCHVPRLYGPALKAEDRTVVTLEGKPAYQFRGIQSNSANASAAKGSTPDNSLNTAYLSGYEPFLLPRLNGTNDYTVSPFNLVTRWNWKSAGTGQEVPFETLAKIYLETSESGGVRYAADILALLDTDKNNRLDAHELVLDSPERQQLIKEKLSAAGIADPVITGTIDAYKINHGVIKVKLMKRDCSTCHARHSRFGSVIPLTDRAPQGVMPEFAGNRQENRGQAKNNPVIGKILRTKSGGLEIRPDEQIHYVFGHSRISSIDKTGFWIFILSLLFVLLHGGKRYINHLKHPAPRTAMKEVYMYRFYERLWHWTMAFAVILLALTGFEIHYTGTFNFFGLETSVRLHNVLAGILVVNSGLSLFYHVITGEIKQFFRFHRKFIHEILVQVFYYIHGIFTHQPHPIDKSPERKLNPLQQLTYILLLNVLLPFQVITGIFIWAIGYWPQLSTKVGGIAYLAPIHHLAAWLFLTFLVVHIYLTSTGHTVTGNLKAMITGVDEIPENEPAEEHRKEHMTLMDMRILDLTGTLIGKLPGKLSGKLSGTLTSVKKTGKKSGK